MTTFPQENTSKLHNKNNELHNNRGENTKIVTSENPINHDEDELRTNEYGGRFVPVKDKLQSDIYDASHTVNGGNVLINYDRLADIITSHLQSAVKEQTSKVDRLEVIDETGRAYVKGSIYGTPVSVELSYQDDNRTLKVFVTQLTTNKGKE